MKKLTLLTIVLFTALSCNEDYEFWSRRNFNIQPDFISNGTGVKMLFSGGSPEETFNSDFYLHLIGVVDKTGDTINILTFDNSNLNALETHKTYYYYDAEVFMDKFNIEPIHKKPLIEGLNTRQKIAKPKSSVQVIRNNYPTVIGYIQDHKIS